MTQKKLSSIERVRQHGMDLELAIEILELPNSTRTARDAAEACHCEVSQIVKSMIFERNDTGSLLLILVSGAHNANLEQLAEYFACELKRADPKKIRAETGFAIGGVAPIGHLSPIEIFMDITLMKYEAVWAAAGKPNALFSIAPAALAKATNAELIKVT